MNQAGSNRHGIGERQVDHQARDQQAQGSPFVPEAYPWREMLEDYIHTAAADTESGSFEPTGWSGERKLDLLLNLVTAYSVYQDELGAIIDPYSAAERYYSTPGYALAAAVLVHHGYEELLPSAEKALSHSIRLLTSGQAPDSHPDFFPVLIMGAYRLLSPRLPGQAAVWRKALSQIQPEDDYVFTMRRQNNPNRMINWNAIMISGEYLRFREGLASESSWMDEYLQLYHLPRFTPLGFYQDGPLHLPNSPFAYDIVTRYHLGVMCAAGYGGAAAQELRRSLRQGALSSLLTLSPLGELPPRGRSSQHQWNEGAAAFVFTDQAQQAQAAGETVLAGAFRRAANLCWAAVDRWRDADGSLHIVRNYYRPADRHGYEVYTNHTCYNLWTAAALAYALLHEERLALPPEMPVPAEAGSRVLVTDGWFQTVVAQVPGQQVVVQTSLNDPYNIPGIVRIQRAGLPALIGPSAGGHLDRGFTGFAEGETFPLSYSPAWMTLDGTWHSLSEGIRGSQPFDRDIGIDPADGGGTAEVRLLSAAAGCAEWEVSWSGSFAGVSQVSARFCQRPGHIQVTYRLKGDVEKTGALLPLFAYDGREHSEIAVGEDRASVRYGGAALVITAAAGTRLTEPPLLNQVASRNGWLKGIRLEAPDHREISFVITLDQNGRQTAGEGISETAARGEGSGNNHDHIRV
ncbi:glycosyl hydrolase [Paenibacillus sp. JX-17]|uniref:Glycosyl hydrolase n=1 Tax=Paenibacillus lacisoli TaxID=3064525 RepID=A0ABT9CC80_9BACL|nr:glycosyl hydrolase [Paenibacillus sp. JX-17]MDO7906856.1 glycosyl hydrolase [Paenibacillus sp. JX-17]